MSAGTQYFLPCSMRMQCMPTLMWLSRCERIPQFLHTRAEAGASPLRSLKPGASPRCGCKGRLACAAGLGRALDPGADEDDVVAGTRLELPLWMVRNMAKRGFVSLQCAPPPLHLLALELFC